MKLKNRSVHFVVAAVDVVGIVAVVVFATIRLDIGKEVVDDHHLYFLHSKIDRDRRRVERFVPFDQLYQPRNEAVERSTVRRKISFLC